MRLVLGILLLVPLALSAAGVRVLFDPSRIEVGPFPTDALTVADAAQRTGRRVNLPLPDCGREPSTCGEYSIVNTYDGFAPQQRVRVRFSGPINPDTLREGIRLVWLEPVGGYEFTLGPVGTVTWINEVVYDPDTNTAYGKPDAPLDQTRRYAVVVTERVRDLRGDPVEADAAFTACAGGETGGEYCASLTAAMRTAASLAPGAIRGGSVYTTLSATAFMESARDRLGLVPPEFRRTGARSVFNLREVTNIVWRQQVRTDGANLFRDVPFIAPPSLIASFGVGRVAFGSYKTGRWLNDRMAFPVLPTGVAAPPAASVEEIFFHVWLPATPPPPGGYPVLLAAHGLGGSRFDMPTAMVAGFMSQGYAVIGITAVGHGFGPRSSLLVTDANGTVELPAPGRGVDSFNAGTIGELAGCPVVAAGAPLFFRDCFRQTALDYVQLVRAIREGMDLDGSGRPTLSREIIHYVGISFGSFVGAIFNAVDPHVTSAVLNVGGDSAVTTGRYSPAFRIPVMGLYLLIRQPSLLNFGRDFFDNWPLRHRPVVVNEVRGAIAIQNFQDMAQWIEAPGMPGNYATHLTSATLPGVPLKRVLFQHAIGDATVPNPANVALVWHANAREMTSVYRHDVARRAVPTLGVNPHAYMAGIDPANPVGTAIALAAQRQAAEFFRSGAFAVPDVNNAVAQFFGNRPIFETPEFLADDLNLPLPQ